MSFDIPEVPEGPIAGEPDNCGESEEVSIHEAVVAVAAELNLLHYVMAEPVIGSAL